jgi:hypothetical protein
MTTEKTTGNNSGQARPLNQDGGIKEKQSFKLTKFTKLRGKLDRLTKNCSAS